jgi:hypothetical protein
MTLSEFVYAILEDTDEWGIIDVRINGYPSAKIRYSDGEVEDVFKPDKLILLSGYSLSQYIDIISAYHVKDMCKAFGKGNRMDYIVLLEEKK